MSTATDALRYAVTAERERRLDELVVEVGGVRYDADRASRDNLAGLLVATAAGVPVPWPISWRCADNCNRPLDYATAAALSAAILAAIQSLYAASWAMKDVAIPALAPSEVHAFDVAAPSRWP
jgi:hypothetical protein